MANIIILEQTCEAFPEQYWAYKGKHKIGYIRLRWGHLLCDYLPKESLEKPTIRVIDYKFNDEYKGEFDNKEKRVYWLVFCGLDFQLMMV